jgi:hypothetical protein
MSTVAIESICPPDSHQTHKNTYYLTSNYLILLVEAAEIEPDDGEPNPSDPKESSS